MDKIFVYFPFWSPTLVKGRDNIFIKQLPNAIKLCLLTSARKNLYLLEMYRHLVVVGWTGCVVTPDAEQRIRLLYTFRKRVSLLVLQLLLP